MLVPTEPVLLDKAGGAAASSGVDADPPGNAIDSLDDGSSGIISE